MKNAVQLKAIVKNIAKEKFIGKSGLTGWSTRRKKLRVFVLPYYIKAS